MKLFCISALLCLSSIYAVVTYLRASPKNDNVVGNGFLRQNRGLGDQCSFVAETTFKGSTTLMDYDQSHDVTQGDMSIANTLMPTDDSYPIIKAMCTITSSDPFQSAPFCTMETTFECGGKIMLMGTPPKLTILGGTGTFFGVWGSMTTNQTFSRSIDGEISFTARIDYCMKEVCANDPNWRTQQNKDCEHVGKKPDARCGLPGSDDIGGARVLASDACQRACGCA